MKGITARNLPPHIAPRGIRHHDLDFLCGAWTKQEANEFDESLALQRAIDQELWK